MHSIGSEPERKHRSLPEPSVESDSGNIPALRILLVDDGAETSSTFRRLSKGVRIGKYVVETVAAKQDGFRDIDTDEYDVYVLDHRVGARTGFDFLSWILAGGRRAPIVFVAGPSDHGAGVTAVGSGASCYVVEDSIDSGILELSLLHAVEQARHLERLSNAGNTIDSESLTKTQILSAIARRLRESAASLLDVALRSQKTDLPSPALESFESIEGKANTLLTLANDLYDLSMLDSGHLDFITATFSLRGLVSNVCQTIGTEAGERDIEIVADVSSDIPDAVAGDPGRLRRVIVSFVETVMVRCSTNRVVLGVGVEHRDQKTVTLRFGIQSAGVDLLRDETRFTRHEPVEADLTPAMFLDRAVLGTTVALETVSRMGGRVTVSGENGDTGIHFTIRLEIREDESEVRPIIDDSAPVEGLILVIADVLDVRRSIIESLGEAELPYLAVADVEAWTAARQIDDEATLPALAVIDSNVDSFAVRERLREVAPSVPVVVAVASGTRGDATRCRESGVRGYLAKPTDPGDLVDIIRSTMGLISAGDQTTLVTRHWLREGRLSLDVLVVDDSATARFLLTRMLEQRGHSTTQASDGREALEAVRAGSYDVILLDILMPEMGGLETTRRIRDLPAGPEERPYIVGVSAFADRDNVNRAHDAGMDDFLSKPVRPNDLFAAVEKTRKVTSPEYTDSSELGDD